MTFSEYLPSALCCRFDRLPARRAALQEPVTRRDECSSCDARLPTDVKGENDDRLRWLHNKIINYGHGCRGLLRSHWRHQWVQLRRAASKFVEGRAQTLFCKAENYEIRSERPMNFSGEGVLPARNGQNIYNTFMSTDISLQQAVEAFTVKLPPQKHMEAQEALKLARWYGEGQPAAALRPIDIEHYVETFGLNSPLARGRADSLKAFLNFADKASMTSSRLVSHVRVRRPAGSRNAASKIAEEDQGFRMTSAGKAAIQAELDELISARPRIAEELRQARSDGDFSENAPLDAARESQGKLEGRIRDLEAKLHLAVIVENDDSASTAKTVRIGSKVVISELTSGVKREYQIVNASEAQGAGRLSHDSPVGRAIVGHRVGDVVSVTAPRGQIEYRIDGVNA